jgi:hypothetical protein
MQRFARTGRAFGFLASLALLAGSASAQSLYGFDGGGSIVLQFTGPPAPPCGYPTGPILGIPFPSPMPFACPTAITGGPPPGIFGDIAVDKAADTIWVTDGFLLTEYTPAGVVIRSFLLPPGLVVPGPLTGLGYDPTLGGLWVTDGLMGALIAPPPPPGCGGLPLVLFPAFPLIAGGGAPPFTDIEMDPFSGTLFLCDAGGVISNVVPPGGAPGPFAPFLAVGGFCPLAAPLQGLGFDTAATPVNALPTLYVTDGFIVAYMLPGGPPAPPTFYTPAPCYPTPGPLLGLAFAARAIPYGPAGDNGGGIPPSIGSAGGQTVPGNAGFMITITGSPPGSAAFLFGSKGFLCPAPLFMGVPIDITLAPLFILGSGFVPAAGTLAIAAPIPPAAAPGAFFTAQWFVVTPAGSLQTTDGLAFTVSAP